MTGLVVPGRMIFELTVYGTPAPQGSKRFVGVKGGRGVMVESSKKVRPWRQDVKLAARELIESIPFTRLDGPLRARMIFTVKRPSSASKRRKWPDRMPDLSKLVRATEDALTDAGVWADDARVVEYTRVAKVYPGLDPEALDVPGVKIVVEEVLAGHPTS